MEGIVTVVIITPIVIIIMIIIMFTIMFIIIIMIMIIIMIVINSRTMINAVSIERSHHLTRQEGKHVAYHQLRRQRLLRRAWQKTNIHVIILWYACCMVDILCTCLCINTYALYVAVAIADSQLFVFLLCLFCVRLLACLLVCCSICSIRNVRQCEANLLTMHHSGQITSSRRHCKVV